MKGAKFFTLCVVLVTTACFCGCTGSDVPSPPASTPVAAETPAELPSETPAPANRLSGSGNASEQMTLAGNQTWIFSMTHTGSGPFSVQVENENVLLWPVHTTGPYTGAQAFGSYGPESYFVNVTADGAWTISAEEPGITEESLLLSFECSGDSVTPFFTLPAENVTFTMENDGPGDFGVWLYDDAGNFIMDPTGTYVMPLAWHEGAYHGSAAVDINQSGCYLLSVHSAANWTVSVADA